MVSYAAEEAVKMIMVTGDCHGGFQRFKMRHFPEQAAMDRGDYIIICGDFGGIWDGSSNDQLSLDWLEARSFTTLFVSGNHENFDLLAQYPVEEWHGGQVQRIRPHVIHLMRGQLYEIDGCTFFTMGGASSHDIEDGLLDPNAPDFEEVIQSLRNQGRGRFRVIGRFWWPAELPSEEEYLEALETLEQANWKVDYVITHCAPTSIAKTMNRHYQPDALTDFLEMVNKRLDFRY